VDTRSAHRRPCSTQTAEKVALSTERERVDRRRSRAWIGRSAALGSTARSRLLRQGEAEVCRAGARAPGLVQSRGAISADAGKRSRGNASRRRTWLLAGSLGGDMGRPSTARRGRARFASARHPRDVGRWLWAGVRDASSERGQARRFTAKARPRRPPTFCLPPCRSLPTRIASPVRSLGKSLVRAPSGQRNPKSVDHPRSGSQPTAPKRSFPSSFRRVRSLNRDSAEKV